MGKVFLFLRAIVQNFTVMSWHCHSYSFLNKLFRFGFMKTFFVTYYFSPSLTSTQTLTFGYIKLILDVALTGNFLDIVFGEYVR